MNSKKRTTSRLLLVMAWFLTILLSFTATCSTAEASILTTNPYKVKVEEATPEFYVNDFAGIFTEEQKDSMIRAAKQLEQDYNGVQVVVTTVKTFRNRSAEEYSYAMYAQYGIGKDDMGVLVLLSTEDRELKVETGLNMQIYLTDKLLDDLSEEYAMEYLRANRFADGIVALQNAIISEIPNTVPADWERDLGISKSDPMKEQATKPAESANEGSDWKLLIAVGLVIFLLFMLLLQAKAYRSKETQFAEKLEREKKSCEKSLNTLQEAHKQEKEVLMSEAKNKLDACTQKCENLLKEKETMEKKLIALRNRYERAKRLYPRMESDIDAMIVSELKSEASKVDTKLAKYVKMQANRENVEAFSEALQILSQVPDELRPYLRTDAGRLQQMYSDSVEFRRKFEKIQQENRDREAATKVHKHIVTVMMENHVGNKDNYKKLKSAYDKYNALTISQKAFFSEPNLVKKLYSRMIEAERDWKNYDAATLAHRKVNDIIATIYSADEDDLDRLETALGYYNDLSEEQKKYFSTRTYKRLLELLKQARDDYEEREAERDRIRRMNMYNAATSARNLTSSSTTHRSSGGSAFSRPSSTPRPRGGSRPSSAPSHRPSGGLGGRPSGGGIHKKF